MSVTKIRKQIDENGIEQTSLMLITLPSDGAWSEPVDLFGRAMLQLLARNSDAFTANVQYSADGVYWAAINDAVNTTVTFAAGTHPAPSQLGTEFADGQLFALAPFIRFQAADVGSRGKSFYLYCL